MDTVGGQLLGFKRHLQVAVVPGEAAYLVSARGVTALKGRLIEILAPLLDGSRSFAAIVREAAPELRADQVGALLSQLAQADMLAFRETEPDPAAAPARAYWDLAGLDGAAADRAMAATPVELVVVGSVDLEPVRAALYGSGLTVAGGPAGPGGAALCLVLCEDYLDPRLAAVARARAAEDRPWLLAKASGPEPWIGPFFQPGTGACWSCLAYRLEELHRPELRVRQALAGHYRLPEASIAAARSVAAQLLVLEAAKWLAGVREKNQDCVYSLDTLTLSGRHHPVARRPQCPECGDPELMAAQAGRPIVLCSRPPAAGGGLRAASKEEVFDQYRHLIDPVTGVVKELLQEEHPGDSVYRCAASTSVLIYGEGVQEPGALLRTVNGGRGSTALEARVGALAEAVERYCAFRQGDERVVRVGYRDLGPQAVHPDTCQLFDSRQYADRDRWNRRHGSEHWVCEPFDEAQDREWTPVWSLTEERARLLPTAMLYFHYGRPGASRQVYADSNGNAAGASLEDAIVHGFLELAERDAVAVWWYNRTRQPQVDLDAFADPWVEQVCRAPERVGRRIWVLDLTTDLGVPVFAALSAAVGGDRPGPRIGFGAHLDPRVALRRALAELGQAALALQTGPDSGGPGGGGDRAARPRDPETGLDLYLLPAPGPMLGPQAYPYTPRADLRDEVLDIAELLRGRGLDLLALDQTRPDIGMPVVKVLVPGLRPMRARFAPGRLFDVPVLLGRLAEPTRYDQLNPVPVPL